MDERMPLGPAHLAVQQVTLSTSPAQVTALGANDMRRRKRITIRNLDASITVYVGGAGVSSTTGYPLLGATGAGDSITLNTQDAVFAVGASGTPKVAVIEEFD